MPGANFKLSLRQATDPTSPIPARLIHNHHSRDHNEPQNYDYQFPKITNID